MIAAAGVTADTSVLTGTGDGAELAASAEETGEKQEVKGEPKPDTAELLLIRVHMRSIHSSIRMSVQ